MGSLYKQAQQLLSNESGLTPTERREIRAQIDQILAGNRMEIRPETLVYRPRRNGSLLPILINVFAVILAAAGIAGMLLLFNRSEGKIVGVEGRIESAEGRLLQALKKEAEEQLSRQGPGDQLHPAAARRRPAASASACRRRRRPASATRKRSCAGRCRTCSPRSGRSCSAKGCRPPASSSSCGRWRRSRPARWSSGSRASARRRRAALKERESALAVQMQDYEQALQSNRREQEKLRQELQQREGQAAAASADSAELARLRDQGRREQAVSDQVLARYLQVRADLSASRYPQALQALEGLREFLRQPAVAGIPGVQKRLPQEAFVIESLRAGSRRPPPGGGKRPPPRRPPRPPGAGERPPGRGGPALPARGDRPGAGPLPPGAGGAAGHPPLLRAAAGDRDRARDRRQKLESEARIAEADRLLKAGDHRRALDRYAQSQEPQGEAKLWGRILAAVRDSGLQAGRVEEAGAAAAAARRARPASSRRRPPGGRRCASGCARRGRRRRGSRRWPPRPPTPPPSACWG